MLSSLLRRLAGIARRIVAAIWRTNTSINPPTNGLSNRAIDMPIPSSMGDLSVTESSNSPNGSDAISTGLDNYLRAIQSIVRSTNFKGPDIASASSVAIGASTGEFLTVTGTTGITSFDSVSAGIVRVVHFSGALTITHSSNIILPGSLDYTTAAGDVLAFRSLGSGQWRCVGGTRLTANTLFAGTVIYDSTDPENPVWRFGVISDGASSWSVAESGTGVFTITHNLSLSSDLANLVVVPASYGNASSIVSWAPKDADSFYVYTFTNSGAAASLDFTFSALRIGV